MPKIKKNRKVGQIGVRSVPKADRVRKPVDDRKKKKNGRPSGSRQNVEQPTKSGATDNSQRNDPRLGSKKPVPLIANDKPVVKSSPKKHFSPAQELQSIESDIRLEKLLNKLDQNKKLSADDQQYVDKLLARHKVLCDLLNIDDEPEEDEQQETDLLVQLERNNLDKFK